MLGDRYVESLFCIQSEPLSQPMHSLAAFPAPGHKHSSIHAHHNPSPIHHRSPLQLHSVKTGPLAGPRSGLVTAPVALAHLLRAGSPQQPTASAACRPPHGNAVERITSQRSLQCCHPHGITHQREYDRFSLVPPRVHEVSHTVLPDWVV